MALVVLTGTRLEVNLLAVAPAEQGTGVARALITALLTRYPTVTTWTELPLLAEALGFVRTGQIAGDRVELSTSPDLRTSPVDRAALN